MIKEQEAYDAFLHNKADGNFRLTDVSVVFYSLPDPIHSLAFILMFRI